MDKIKHNIKLDLADGGSQDAVYLRQNDTKAHLLIFQLRTNGRTYRIADNVVAKIRGTREDGSIIYNACTIEDNTIRAEISTDTISVPGRVECVLELTGTEPAVLTTPGFDIIVERVANSDNDILGTNEFSALVQQTAAAQAATMAANAIYAEVQTKLENGEFIGEQGPQGERGADGAKGEQGERGPAGPAGAQGPQGEKGEKGDTGDKGATGADGFSPIIDTQYIQGGHRIIIQDKYTTRHVDVMNGEKGDTGAAGAAGADGVTPEFSIGEVTTLAAGQNATASISGTAEKPVLNLGIPQGEKGEAGGGTGGGTAELPFELVEGDHIVMPKTYIPVGETIITEMVDKEYVVGEEYVVVYNGTEYVITCAAQNDTNGNLAYTRLDLVDSYVDLSIEQSVTFGTIYAYAGTRIPDEYTPGNVTIYRRELQVPVQNIPQLHSTKITDFTWESLREKPFKTTTVKGEVILPEQVVAKNERVSDGPSVVTGEKYIVAFNGNERPFVCAEVKNSDGSVWYQQIGFETLSEDDSFYIRFYADGSWRLSMLTGSEATIAIYATVEQIPKRNIEPPSWNDLTDRPFYEEREETVVLEEVTLEYNADIDGHALPQQVIVVDGGIYDVVYDGEVYRTVCKQMYEGDIPIGVLGNIGLIQAGEDTGDPFVIMCFPQEGFDAVGVWGMVIAFDGSADPVTVSITHVVETIKKLDPKFVEADWHTMINKPFYTAEEVGTVLAETTLALNAQFGFFVITEDFVVKAGRDYTVVYNGTTYHTNCYSGTDYDENGDPITTIVLGNGSAMGGVDTGEPFLIMYSPEQLQMLVAECYAAMITLDGAESVTISIEGPIETIHKLDPKYIDVDVAWDDISDRPFYKEWVDGEVLPETSLTKLLGGMFCITNQLSMRAWKTYAVVFNGTAYDCVATIRADTDDTGNVIPTFMLGDVERIETGEATTDEPFAIISSTQPLYGSYHTVCYAFDNPDSVTLSIGGFTEVVHKIPEEYLPAEDIKAKSVVIDVSNSSTDYPFDEIWNLDEAEILATVSIKYSYSNDPRSGIYSVFGVAKDEDWTWRIIRLVCAHIYGEGRVRLYHFAWYENGEVTGPIEATIVPYSMGWDDQPRLALYAKADDTGGTSALYITKASLIQDVIAALPIYNGEVEEV